MQIGPYKLRNNLLVAPMAGVTDRPFRQLCKRLGAGMAVCEMVTSDPNLWGTQKTQRRMDHTGESEPIAVQIAGADPEMMTQAAQYNLERGAQIIDINMGCPAKKVCNRAAGSALLRDVALVGRILDAVVKAVPVPVTLKIRTGWDKNSRNAVRVAHIAESAGVQVLAIHGRTRGCGFSGDAEYDTIREVKSQVRIPVVANGDITSPEKAKEVLTHTGADAIMIGRAAQGRPWIFREITYYLDTGRSMPPPQAGEVHRVLSEHLRELYAFYGAQPGVRIARKHIHWYTQTLPGSGGLRQSINRLESASEQLAAVDEFFHQLAQEIERPALREQELAA